MNCAYDYWFQVFFSSRRRHTRCALGTGVQTCALPISRSLAECLALQLRERDRYDPAMQTLVENLELLAKGERARLKKICGVDQEDLFEMIAEIKALDPRPALSFEGEVAPPVIPDVVMRPDRQGGWLVELNSETVPREHGRGAGGGKV